jgi:hypothetical protein
MNPFLRPQSEAGAQRRGAGAGGRGTDLERLRPLHRVRRRRQIHDRGEDALHRRRHPHRPHSALGKVGPGEGVGATDSGRSLEPPM